MKTLQSLAEWVVILVSFYAVIAAIGVLVSLFGAAMFEGAQGMDQFFNF